MALTMVLTRDIREAEKMFRLAAFNVLAHNRDDHAKNFSFLMNKYGEWRLSPAYDVTFSSGPRGEQSTMVMGEVRNPGPADLIKLGREAKLPEGRVSAILEQTMSVLSGWPRLAFRIRCHPLKCRSDLCQDYVSASVDFHAMIRRRP